MASYECEVEVRVRGTVSVIVGADNPEEARVRAIERAMDDIHEGDYENGPTMSAVHDVTVLNVDAVEYKSPVRPPNPAMEEMNRFTLEHITPSLVDRVFGLGQPLHSSGLYLPLIYADPGKED